MRNCRRSLTGGKKRILSVRKSFKVGTKQEAEKNGWVSLDNIKKELNNSEEELSQFLYSLTSFTQDESV